MRLADIVRAKRQTFKETQEQFGKRFGVTPTAVSLWESANRDVPNRVIEELLDMPDVKFILCDACHGSGLVAVK